MRYERESHAYTEINNSILVLVVRSDETEHDVLPRNSIRA